MSDENAEKALNPFDVPDDITDYSHDEAYERGVNAGIAWSAGRFPEHRGEDQSECPCPACEHYELVNARAAERTRADEDEAEVARLREVIERAKEYPDLPKGLWNLLDLAAVPVEPQAEVDTTRERIARNGDMVLRGQGVISDSNGPFRLSLKVDGIWQPVVLNTYDWNVEWADQQTHEHENGSE